MNPQVFLSKSVFNAAKGGKAIFLAALLLGKDTDYVRRILTAKHDSGDNHCTALIIAAHHGHDSVVQLLLDQFKVDPNQTGTVKFSGYTIEEATALWTASCAGHYNIVKMLIEKGADINKPTLTKSTPLRAACYEGRLDIVKFLVANNADINTTNKFGNSCLMIAGYKGHLDVIRYLLVKGVNPNFQAHCGNTALHFAAEFGHLAVVKELCRNSAQHLVNKQNLTPLMAAAENCQAEVVEYLLDPTLGYGITRREHITALELLGASYANCKENYNIAKTYHYLYWALVLRNLNPDEVLLKEVNEPLGAYEFTKESTTIDELNAKQDDDFALQMEALIVRERILGFDHPDLLHPIVFRGAVCADNFQFTRCIRLWKRAIFLRHKQGMSVQKDLLRFAQVFSQMLHIGHEVCVKDVLYSLEMGLTEIKKCQNDLTTIEPDNEKAAQKIYSNTIYTMLYLMSIFIHQGVKSTQEHLFQFRKLIYQFLVLNPRTQEGFTPLHLSADQNTPVDDFHTNNVCSFPSLSLVKTFITCGANPNDTDLEGNTPLHIIVKHNKPISDFMTLHAIIQELLSAGCHVDRKNCKRLTAEEASTTGVAEVLVKTMTKVGLKCLAARVVKKYGVPYKGIVPKTLEEFIEIH